jgi:hypothetical protein
MTAPVSVEHPQSAAKGSNGWIANLFNAYLLAFAIEGLLSLLQKILGGSPAGLLLAPAKALASFGSVLLAVCVTLIVCSYRRVRWMGLLPALALTFWKAFYFLPLPAYFSWSTLELCGALAQTSAGVATFLLLRARSQGASFLLPREATCQAEFSWTRTGLTLVLKLCAVLPGLVLYVLISARILIHEYSSGFLEVNSTGIYTEARTYERGGHKIYLLPTIHIASPAFYDTLMEGLPEKSSAILPEGVTDQQGVLKDLIDYSGAANSVGLSSQPDLTAPRKSHTVLRCDADVSEFSLETRKILNGLGRVLKNLKSGDLEATLSALETLDEEPSKAVWKDILETRNNKVLVTVSQALPQYEHIAVPWGAAHMPGIERGLLEMKARRIEARRVEVFKWTDLKIHPEP